jgi:hypothetical protein
MTLNSAVTIIAARYDRVLAKGEDTSGHPVGASLFSAGTETDWATETGFPRRDRTVRIWLAIWPDPEQAADYHADRLRRIPILSQAVESMSVVCHPFACHGEVNWAPGGKAANLYPVLARRPADISPILVMTTLGIGDPNDGLIEFGQGVTAVRKAFAENPAVIADMNMLPDIPMIDGPTLTFWRSERAMMDGAYRSEPHRSTMKMRNGATARASFTRMAVTHAEGAWGGVDLATAFAGPEAA